MHWGTKIAISLAIFITFIIILGFLMINSNKEGVETDYYEKDLRYEQEIQALRNAQNLSEKVIFEVSEGKLLIRYPKEIENYEGKVLLLRPDDSRKDKTEPMRLDSEKKQIIDLSPLQKGLWKVQVSWKMQNKSYQTEKFDIIVP
jgi:hypothetical protein